MEHSRFPNPLLLPGHHPAKASRLEDRAPALAGLAEVSSMSRGGAAAVVAPHWLLVHGRQGLLAYGDVPKSYAEHRALLAPRPSQQLLRRDGATKLCIVWRQRGLARMNKHKDHLSHRS